MGSGASAHGQKTIYLDVDGKIQKVVFSQHSSPAEIKELLCASAGLPWQAAIILLDKKGTVVATDSTIPKNSKR
ncbi:hypothetical protein XENTR_v10018664 [Xenopus tropicalis]|nr:hypothetical protein XENTR_v10018664 [Xenopus tropicalis]